MDLVGGLDALRPVELKEAPFLRYPIRFALMFICLPLVTSLKR